MRPDDENPTKGLFFKENTVFWQFWAAAQGWRSSGGVAEGWVSSGGVAEGWVISGRSSGGVAEGWVGSGPHWLVEGEAADLFAEEAERLRVCWLMAQRAF